MDIVYFGEKTCNDRIFNDLSGMHFRFLLRFLEVSMGRPLSIAEQEEFYCNEHGDVIAMPKHIAIRIAERLHLINGTRSKLTAGQVQFERVEAS